MQKFITKIRKNIDSFEKSTSRQVYELAIIKYLLIELSKICFRDDRFFLYKEDLEKRRKLYNKKICLHFKKNNIRISCKSYSLLIKELLKKCGITVKLYSVGKDEFKHYGLIYEHKNNKYYIDPLHDLVNLKIGAETEYFGIEYKNLKGLKIIINEERQEINRIVNSEGICYNDFLLTLSNSISISDLIKNAQCHCRMRSVADFVIFLNKIINDVDFSYKKEVQISYCITLKKIKTETNVIIKKDVEGVCVKNHECEYYYFPSINELISSKCPRGDIFVKQKYELKTYSYLKTKNGNRQILDNTYFQKLLHEYEEQYNIGEKDIEVDEKHVFIIPLNVNFFIYRKNFLALSHNDSSFYFKIKKFGYLVYNKRIRINKKKYFMESK